MLIARISGITGERHEREIDITPEELAKWESGMLIQHVVPHLSAEDREFIITGTTPEEWEEQFPLEAGVEG